MLMPWLVSKLQIVTFLMIKALPCIQVVYNSKPIIVLLHLVGKNKSVLDLEPPTQELLFKISTALISLMLTIKIPQCSQFGIVTQLLQLKQCVLHSLHSISLLEPLAKY